MAEQVVKDSGGTPKRVDADDMNVPKFRSAVQWVLDASLKGDGHCAICRWEPWPHNKEQSLQKHIEKKHRSSVVELFDNQVLDLSDLQPTPPADNEDELLATAGITGIEDLDRHNWLDVPDEIRDRNDMNGAVGLWAREDNIDKYKSQGAVVTQATGRHQGSTEDGALRVNELVHMTFPHELAEKRRRQKSGRINDQNVARAEEKQQIMDKYEQRTFDYLRKERGLDSQKAGQLAKALEGRRRREQGES
tara:strand:- start:6229 stop:6975 length:747 start_codon:yes stop_codon:yes gene_type:complete